MWRRSGAKIFIWSTVAALVVGALGLMQPLDDQLRVLRNMARQKAPSGDIVVIGIDDKSLEHIGSWPWSRTRHAELVDKLKAAGADRIFFDIFFNATTTKTADRALGQALKRAGNVYLAATKVENVASGDMRSKLPLEPYRKVAGVVSVATKYAGSSAIRATRYDTDFGDFRAPTMAVELAKARGQSGEAFPIDYAIDLSAIPFVSADDVLSGNFDPRSVRGKSVIIGAGSVEMGDLYYLPGRGQINGVYINVLAAETLKAGGTINLGWSLPVAVISLLCAINLFARRRWIGRIALVAGVALLTVGALMAEEHGVFYDIVPALVLLSTSAGTRAWWSFRRSYKVRGNINAVSGLPNLNALREKAPPENAVVVSARVRNYPEISSALPPEAERLLVDQIVARLALGARGASIYQGDEGIFVWVCDPEVAGADQLDALHALFRSPALVDGKPIDLSVTLGIDADGSRTLANRIGATLVAANEASTEGLRWKAYDPAKLADAEWKLSLLGRLDAAIDSGEVWVAYQPQLDLRTGQICGAEALVRWSHPEKGEVSPMEFVLAAEQHNRIDKLTAFVLGDAIRAAAAFQDNGRTFDIAVNISARLLEKPGLVALVRDMLHDSGLMAERLTLEVTESAAMTSGRASIRTLEELGSLGINVSIDDYGTGFSTLEYFKNIPATEVKIDRSFVGAIDRNASDRVMVRSTIELAHSLGRSVVAEGVETQEILSELITMGCDKAQGYLIGRPMKLLSLAKLLQSEGDMRAA